MAIESSDSLDREDPLEQLGPNPIASPQWSSPLLEPSTAVGEVLGRAEALVDTLPMSLVCCSDDTD